MANARTDLGFGGELEAFDPKAWSPQNQSPTPRSRKRARRGRWPKPLGSRAARLKRRKVRSKRLIAAGEQGEMRNSI